MHYESTVVGSQVDNKSDQNPYAEVGKDNEGVTNGRMTESSF